MNGRIYNFADNRRPRAFTLVEVLVAVAILGLVFTTLMEAFNTGLKMHEQSQHMTVAAALAEEIHEMTLTLPLRSPAQPAHWGPEAGEELPFDDLDDFDGQSFCPPVFADGTQMAGLADYAQRVKVECVSSTNYNQTVAAGASNVLRVTVTITWRGQEVCNVSWLTVGGP